MNKELLRDCRGMLRWTSEERTAAHLWRSGIRAKDMDDHKATWLEDVSSDQFWSEIRWLLHDWETGKDTFNFFGEKIEPNSVLACLG